MNTKTISLLTLMFALSANAAPTVDFSRDIRPILSDNCFYCHGPDKNHRKAKLRLDTREGAFHEKDGIAAVVAGNLDDSELWYRITADDEEDLMPPVKSNKKLSARQKTLIKAWIEQGAKWEDHWSFQTPKKPKPPSVKNEEWVRNAIDRFVLARLEAAALNPSREAGKNLLIRRVTFDLTGLPPTTVEVEAFLKDASPNAYEKLVDRLLSSERYGEHMARFWLDVVRYGDTHGLHLDNYREMWPYRDWVIEAFNANKPFDTFVIEQIAGDLIAGASLDQQIASGYNRCHVTTNEGGSIKEEVYVRNVVDRVATTSTVFMGLSGGCAVCHDHKFDPLTQKDFYSMFAFFNSMEGNEMDGNKKDPAPVVRALTPDMKRKSDEYAKQLAAVQDDIKAKVAAFKYVEPTNPRPVKPAPPRELVWFDDNTPGGAKTDGNTPWKFVDKSKAPVFSGNVSSTRTAKGLSQHFFTGAKKPLVVGKGDVLFSHVYLDPKNPPKQIMLQWNDGNWDHRAYWGGNHINWGKDKTGSRLHMGKLPATGKWVRLSVPVAKVALKPGAKINGWAFTQFDGTVYWDKAGVIQKDNNEIQTESLAEWVKYQGGQKRSKLPRNIQSLVKLPRDKRSAAQQKQLTQYFVEHVHTGARKTFDPLHQKAENLQRQIDGANATGPTTLVFRETAKPRDAFLLKRGQYDQRGDKVGRATPAFLPPMKSDLPKNRLGFAKWLLDPTHPLTARVAVNRMWQQVFGVGIVKTSEDFGNQGEQPSHPKLLDWLAVNYRESGWDTKAFMKTMVMSATYRQTSKATPDAYKRDRENRLLARGPRFRLDAEVLRDQALAVSGLLVNQMGGPSVKPPQPDGLWFAVGYSGSNTVRFKRDNGPDKVYRRSVYTFWKRTSPPPMFDILDAPSREECTIRRERTNTPLQAMLLMNEPQYIESARRLAERSMKGSSGGTTSTRAIATHLFRVATARDPDSLDMDDMLAEYRDVLAEYKKDAEAAKKLISVGDSKPDAAVDPSELAAWTMVANMILNLDEVVTKE